VVSCVSPGDQRLPRLAPLRPWRSAICPSSTSMKCSPGSPRCTPSPRSGPPARLGGRLDVAGLNRPHHRRGGRSPGSPRPPGGGQPQRRRPECSVADPLLRAVHQPSALSDRLAHLDPIFMPTGSCGSMRAGRWPLCAPPPLPYWRRLEPLDVRPIWEANRRSHSAPLSEGFVF